MSELTDEQLEAQQNILGCMLSNTTEALWLANAFDPAAFIDDFHATIYRYASHQLTAAGSVDPAQLMALMVLHPQWEEYDRGRQIADLAMRADPSRIAEDAQTFDGILPATWRVIH